MLACVKNPVVSEQESRHVRLGLVCTIRFNNGNGIDSNWIFLHVHTVRISNGIGYVVTDFTVRRRANYIFLISRFKTINGCHGKKSY